MHIYTLQKPAGFFFGILQFFFEKFVSILQLMFRSATHVKSSNRNLWSISFLSSPMDFLTLKVFSDIWGIACGKKSFV